MALPLKFPEYVLIAFACLLIGYGTGAVVSARRNSLTLDETVAVKWSDGVHDGPAYGAHVYLDPYMTNDFRGLAVRVRVFIGREKHEQKFSTPHHLGLTRTQAEAVRQWGNIRWANDGLHLGEGNHSVLIPIHKIKPQW